MIKKLLLAVALAIPMFVSAQTVKIGVVDINTIIAAMPETTTAQTKVNDASKKYDEEYTRLNDEMKRMYEEYTSMKEDELQAIKDRKARELQDYQTKIQTFEQNAYQDLQKMQQELMAPIVAKVRSAIESVGKEGNFSYIQDNNSQITLYYASPTVDITNDVKAKLGLK